MTTPITAAKDLPLAKQAFLGVGTLVQKGRHFRCTASRELGLVGEGWVRFVEEREKTQSFSPPPPPFLNPSSSPSESFLGSPQPSVTFIIQDGGIEYSYPVSYPLPLAN